jgi:hypothetical protein
MFWQSTDSKIIKEIIRLTKSDIMKWEKLSVETVGTNTKTKLISKYNGTKVIISKSTNITMGDYYSKNFSEDFYLTVDNLTFNGYFSFYKAYLLKKLFNVIQKPIKKSLDNLGKEYLKEYESSKIEILNKLKATYIKHNL